MHQPKWSVAGSLYAVRGAYHGKEVVKACDGAWHAGELLAEGVAQVMRWVRGDDEHIPSGCRQLHRQAAESKQSDIVYICPQELQAACRSCFSSLSFRCMQVNMVAEDR